MDTVDINSDGNVDQCELAHYMKFLGVPEKELMDRAEIDIQFTIFTADVDESPPYISKADHLKYALNIRKFGFVLQWFYMFSLVHYVLCQINTKLKIKVLLNNKI